MLKRKKNNGPVGKNRGMLSKRGQVKVMNALGGIVRHQTSRPGWNTDTKTNACFDTSLKHNTLYRESQKNVRHIHPTYGARNSTSVDKKSIIGHRPTTETRVRTETAASSRSSLRPLNQLIQVAPLSSLLHEDDDPMHNYYFATAKENSMLDSNHHHHHRQIIGNHHLNSDSNIHIHHSPADDTSTSLKLCFNNNQELEYLTGVDDDQKHHSYEDQHTFQRNQLASVFYHTPSRSGDERGTLGLSGIQQALMLLGLNAPSDQIDEFITIVNEGTSDRIGFEEFSILVGALVSADVTMDWDSAVDQTDRVGHRDIPTEQQRSCPPNQSPERTNPALDVLETNVLERTGSNNLCSSLNVRQIVGNHRLLEHLDVLEHELLEHLLEDCIDVLNQLDASEDSGRPGMRKPRDLSTVSFDQMQILVNGIEKYETMLQEKYLLGAGDNEQGEEDNESIIDTALLPRQVIPASTVDAALADTLETNKATFVRYRSLVESSLYETGFKQSDIVEILQELLLDDLLDISVIEFEQLFDQFSEKVALTL